MKSILRHDLLIVLLAQSFISEPSTHIKRTFAMIYI